MALRELLKPLEINGLEIRNRIFRPAHGTHYGHGQIVDDTINYHVARAKAGVGLSVLEVSSVHPSAWIGTIWSWDESIVAGYRRLTDAVRPHGMRMFSQLWHGGHHWPNANGGPGWSPSDVPSPWGPVPHAMTRAEISEIVAAFAQSAIWSREGGLDGIELHFGHGYLATQFLSPTTNRRVDEYGGSLENRMRFVMEVTRAVRAAVGDDHPVGIRISDEHIDGGLSVSDCAAVVQALCAEKLIDFVDASMGSYYSTHDMLPTMDRTTGAMLPSSGPIAAAADVPTMICGLYRTLEEGEQALRDGVASMVGFARAMIAEPDLVRKTLAGTPERVRPCISCNQGCVAGILSPEQRMLCTVNPTVGHEATLHEDLIERTEAPRKVLVIGGGPAGMEAARLAALKGHEVILCEAQPRLGGAVNIAARAPKAQGIADITTWLEQEIFLLGVEVRTSTFIEANEIADIAPDVVIVATGSFPRLDGYQAVVGTRPATGADLPHVRSSHEIFDLPPSQLGATALVLDDTGHYEAIGVAEYLANAGLSVTYVTPLNSFAPKMELPMRAGPALARLRATQRFRLMTRTRLSAIRAGSAEVHCLDGGAPDIVPADTVVLVTANRSNNAIVEEIAVLHEAEPPFELFVIGDAEAPRDLLVAIREGHHAGRNIS